MQCYTVLISFISLVIIAYMSFAINFLVNTIYRQICRKEVRFSKKIFFQMKAFISSFRIKSISKLYYSQFVHFDSYFKNIFDDAYAKMKMINIQMKSFIQRSLIFQVSLNSKKIITTSHKFIRSPCTPRKSRM